MPETTESATPTSDTSDQLSAEELRQLAEIVYKMILKDLKVERERRG